MSSEKTGRARREDLGQVAPVHADVVNRSLDTVRGQRRERLLQKRGERLAAHLPGGHGELAVFDAAQPAGMSVDRDVVGRIGEDQAGLLTRHQGGEHGRVAHIATDQPVRPELPDLAPVDPGGGGVREGLVGRVVRLLGGDGRQEGVDLRNREARDGDVEVEVRGQQHPQFSGEPVLVPVGIERQFVVGDDIGALLGLAQVLDLQTGHLGQAEEVSPRPRARGPPGWSPPRRSAPAR